MEQTTMPQASLTYVPVKKIVPNVLNPRKDMGDIAGLRDSIVQHGLIVPLVVRQYQGNGKFELVAGERRFTAIQDAITRKELPKDYEVPIILREIDDQATAQVMLIENLMRKDLTDYEQAASFQEYLEKYDDPKAVNDLAEKTGVNIQYIRRRVKVMTLPESVLDLWKAGKILYGHCEQLMRVDADTAIDLARQIVSNGVTISRLKEVIENQQAILSDALFDKKAAGCNTCQFSTKIQKALFGDDMKAEKVMCTKSQCYFDNQIKFIEENWDHLPAVMENKTRGVLLHDGNWFAGKSIYNEPHELCLACDKFVTVVDKTAKVLRNKACNGHDECFQKIYHRIGTSSASTDTPEAKQAKKTENIGKDFSERFFQEHLTAKMEGRPSDDLYNLRAMLIAMIKTNDSIVSKVLDAGEDWQARNNALTTLINDVLDMDRETVLSWLVKISAAIIMNQRTCTLEERKTIAELYDLRLDRDFLITEDYLKQTRSSSSP